MPPSEGQEPRALTVAAQAIEGRRCAETAKVHPDLRIVYNLAYGALADEAGRFSLLGDYTTSVYTPQRPKGFWGVSTFVIKFLQICFYQGWHGTSQRSQA